MKIDKNIFQSCQNKERKGQEALYRQCYPDLMRLLFRYVRVDADAADILNKGMLKVFLKIEQFGGNEDNFFGWIKRVVINEALDHLRAGNKLSNAEPIENIPEKTELNLVEEKDATQMMQFLLSQLPDLTATVFNLYALEGYSHAEIAEMLEISVANSKWHVFSARKRLQLYLQQNSQL